MTEQTDALWATYDVLVTEKATLLETLQTTTDVPTIESLTSQITAINTSMNDLNIEIQTLISASQIPTD